MAAFYLKGVSPPHVTLNQIFAGMLPFMGIQVVALALLYVFPGIGLWLPQRSLQVAPRAACGRQVARRRAPRGSNLDRAVAATADHEEAPCSSAKSCASRATRCSRRRPTAPVHRRGQGDGAARHRLAGRHGPRHAWSGMLTFAEVLARARRTRRHARRPHGQRRSTSAIR